MRVFGGFNSIETYNICAYLKRKAIPKGNFIFQLSFFRGDVSFREGETRNSRWPRRTCSSSVHGRMFRVKEFRAVSVKLDHVPQIWAIGYRGKWFTQLSLKTHPSYHPLRLFQSRISFYICLTCKVCQAACTVPWCTVQNPNPQSKNNRGTKCRWHQSKIDWATTIQSPWGKNREAMLGDVEKQSTQREVVSTSRSWANNHQSFVGLFGG